MIIRQQRGEEYSLTEKIAETAFCPAKGAYETVPDFLRARRKSENYLPRLDLVAEENSELIGHLMLTKMKLPCADVQDGALLLAPVSVLPEHRNGGVGAALVREGHKRAREMGFTSIFLAGDPAYFRRFGFLPTADFGIQPNSDIPPQYVMACELTQNALEGCAGTLENL